MRIIKKKVGETAIGIWLKEIFSNCLIETPNKTISYDVNLLLKKCRAEPQSVPIVMALLVKGLIKLSGNVDGNNEGSVEKKNNQLTVAYPAMRVQDLKGVAATYRDLVGLLFLCYCVSIGIEDGEIPTEIEKLFMQNPANLIIMECVIYVRDNKGITYNSIKSLS